MASKLLLASLFIYLTAATGLTANVIPIQPGVANTISFACAPISSSSSSSGLSLSGAATQGTGSASGSDLTSLISTLANALGSGATSNAANPNGYTYSFSGLPSWVNSVNGPVISGTPPASGSNSYTITVTVNGANGQATTQNVQLSAAGAPGFGAGANGVNGFNGLNNVNAGTSGFGNCTSNQQYLQPIKSWKSLQSI
jgi:hypothetical protein